MRTEGFVNGHLHLDKVYTLDRIGAAALVVRHHPTLREVLSHRRAPRHVIAPGKVVAGTTSTTDFAPAVRRLAGDTPDREKTA